MAKSAPMNTPLQAAAVVGAGPILAAVARRIGLVATVDQRLTGDATRCRLSPGDRIRALLLNWLTEREPLYQVDDAFRLTDPALLLGAGSRGTTGACAGPVRAGGLRRGVQRSGGAGVRGRGPRPRRHAWGVDGPGAVGPVSHGGRGDGVTPRHGHSKDPRPDVKQILFTCFVNRDGGPLLGRVEDGKRSDQRRNGEPIAHLVAAFSPAALPDLIYIADAALVTGSNLDALHSAGITWLSRLPDPLGVAGAATWTALGPVAARSHAATYWAAEHTATIRDRTYRLVVCRSSRLDQRKAKAFDRELARIRTAADRAAATLADQLFSARPMPRRPRRPFGPPRPVVAVHPDRRGRHPPRAARRGDPVSRHRGLGPPRRDRRARGTPAAERLCAHHHLAGRPL